MSTLFRDLAVSHIAWDFNESTLDGRGSLRLSRESRPSTRWLEISQGFSIFHLLPRPKGYAMKSRPAYLLMGAEAGFVVQG
jgi:hypothetical protein